MNLAAGHVEHDLAPQASVKMIARRDARMHDNLLLLVPLSLVQLHLRSQQLCRLPVIVVLHKGLRCVKLDVNQFAQQALFRLV